MVITEEHAIDLKESAKEVNFFPLFLERFPSDLKREIQGYFFLSRANCFCKVHVALSRSLYESGVSVFLVKVKNVKGSLVNFFKLFFCDDEELKDAIFKECEKDDCLFAFDELLFLADFSRNVFNDERNFLEVFSKYFQRRRLKISILGREMQEREISGRYLFATTRTCDLDKENSVRSTINFLRKHGWCHWKAFPEAGHVYLIKSQECYECGSLATVTVNLSGTSLPLCRRCYYVYKRARKLK